MPASLFSRPATKSICTNSGRCSSCGELNKSSTRAKSPKAPPCRNTALARDKRSRFDSGIPDDRDHMFSKTAVNGLSSHWTPSGCFGANRRRKMDNQTAHEMSSDSHKLLDRSDAVFVKLRRVGRNLTLNSFELSALPGAKFDHNRNALLGPRV